MTASHEQAVTRPSVRGGSDSRELMGLRAAEMGVWDWDPRSGALDWDEQVARLHGVDPAAFDGRMDTFLQRVHPDDRPHLQARIQRALDIGGAFIAEFRVLMPDGRTVWIQGRGRAFHDEWGEPVRMIGVGLDTTELRSVREMAGRSLEHISEGLAILDPQGRVLYLNTRGGELLDREPADALGRVVWDLLPAEAGSRSRREYERAAATQEPVEFEEHYGSLKGWFEVRCYPAPDGMTVFFRDVNERQAADEERARLFASAQAARERLQFLADASSALAGQLGQRDVLQALVDTLVPGIGSGAAVYTAGDGNLTVAASAPGPLRPVDVTPGGGDRWRLVREVHAVAGSGHARLVRGPDGEDPVVLAPVPRGEGRLVLALWGAAEYGAEDVTLVGEVAMRAGMALANAALYEREREVADSLQRAVLPERLPSLDGYELAARYVPSVDGIHVGGDWYDAFPVGAGRVGIVVGDVAGHGLRAAALMGQMRNALRAYAVQGGGPAAVVRSLDSLLAALEPEALATLVYGELEPASGDLWLVRAGHPAPLIGSAGSWRLLDGCPTPPTGAASLAADDVPVQHVRLAAGDTVCLYTDGLVERRRAGLDQGFARLLAVAGRADERAVPLCDALLEGMLGGDPSQDDVCLLTVTRRSRHA